MEAVGLMQSHYKEIIKWRVGEYMSVKEGLNIGRWALPLLLVFNLFACGGHGSTGDDSLEMVPLSTIQSGQARLETIDPSAPFTRNLPEGVSAVTVSSPAVVSFSLKDTEGRAITGLQAENFRFSLARLQPGSDGQFGVAGSGESAQWISYIYRTKSGTAISDGVQATYESGSDGTLEYDDQGRYYRYTFANDMLTATRPDSSELIWDETATHRLAIQLEVRDSDGERLLFNPHFDFTFNEGASVPVTDNRLTHRVADESSCNQCHNQLIAHGGRVELEYCVMCHNPGSIDVEFGSDIDFKVMIHKIHKGRSLQNDYRIAGYGGTVHEWSEVGYPQDLRNCSKCHDGSNPLTPQGDNWNRKPTQQACGSCHEDVDFNNHQGNDFIADDGSRDNSGCRACHGGAATHTSVANVHWNQLEQNAENYQFNINAVDYDASSRIATVTYSVSNPSDGSHYDLTEGLLNICVDTDASFMADVGAGREEPDDCRDLEGARFSRLTLVIGALTIEGANAGVDDYSDHSASVYAWLGTDNGDGSYTASLSVPAEAMGTARLISSGQAQERRVTDLLDYRLGLELGVDIDAGNAVTYGIDWDWNNRVRVPIKNASHEFSVDGSTLNARRVVVSDSKCNACHGLLGTASGSNTLANAFHRGERSSVEACVICHTPNRASSTEMSDEIVDGQVVEPVLPGTAIRMNQSYEFKTMIHGIHGGEVRATAYMHGTDDLSGETHYPGMIEDCTACHQGLSYNLNQGKLGAAVSREDDLEQRHVFSPHAAACMGCHDSDAARTHMSTSGAGGASVGDFTQAEWLSGVVYERCGECHGPGAARDVRIVHGID